MISGTITEVSYRNESLGIEGVFKVTPIEDDIYTKRINETNLSSKGISLNYLPLFKKRDILKMMSRELPRKAKKKFKKFYEL